MKNILAVEDSIFNLEFIKSMVVSLGYNCDTAQNGSIALDKIKNKKYDLVLMDCKMPKLDGFETTKKIRMNDKKIPIVALSATMSDEDKQRSLLCGMNGFILKPIDLSELEKIILKLSCDLDCSLGEVINKGTELNTVEELILNLQEKMGFNNEQSRYLIVGYIDEFSNVMTKIIDAQMCENYEDVLSFIHQLKGMSSNLRIKGVYDFIKEMENNKYDINRLNEGIDELYRLLKKYLAERESIKKGMYNYDKDINCRRC